MHPIITMADETKANLRKARYKANNVAAGMCRDGCGRPLNGTARCLTCASNHALQQSRLIERNRATGGCAVCRKPKHTATLCRLCACKQIARRARLPSFMATALLQKLDDAKRACPYTGLSIEIGTGASLDHIVPRSKGGTNDLVNLEWVHVKVNMAKSNMSREEFIEFCRLVATMSGKHL